jgi:hypothetical protein
MSAHLDRRRFVTLASALAAALPTLGAAAEKAGGDTEAAIASAEKLLGLEFTPAERKLMAKGLADQATDYQKVHAVAVANAVPPALVMEPLLPGEKPGGEALFRPSAPAAEKAPAQLEEVAFWPVTRLSALLRAREVRSLDLTRMYLDRLRKLDPALHAVVNFTEELALRQAEQADGEIAAGKWRGPLHGVPWGAKDLLAARGYPTTWGSVPFRDQVLDEDAAVVERLAAAGAVLVA